MPSYSPSTTLEKPSTDDIAPSSPELGWQAVRRVQAGDAEAFGAVYDLYVDEVYRFVLGRVRSRELAEDLTAETFLRALRSINRLDYRGVSVAAWLITIARNLILDNAKSANARLVQVLPTSDVPSGSVPSSEQSALEAINRDVLHAAVASLGERQRTCVSLRFTLGCSVRETAQIMNVTEGAVKSLQIRALRTLQRQLRCR